MRSSRLASVMENAKGVFFDLYGTLFVYGDMAAEWSDYISVCYAFLLNEGLSMPEQVFVEKADRFFRNAGLEELPEEPTGLTSFEQRLHAFCSGVNIRLERATASRMASTLLEKAWQKHCPLDPECRPVLRALQGHKTLAVISNFDHPPHIHSTLHKSELREFFSTVVISGDLRIKKPDPRIFHSALKQTGLKAEEVVYVGDAQDDVTGARAAGIVPILLRREVQAAENPYESGTKPGTLPTQPKIYVPADVLTIHSLTELTEFLK